MAVFVDTNILVYAEDLDSGSKQERARAIIQELWRSGEGVLSIQVLQEYFVTVTRKVRKSMSQARALQAVEEYLTWRIVENTRGLLLAAIRRAASARISFWDAQVVQAALDAGCEILYSEDLGDGQMFGSLRVVNPFS